MKRVPVYILVFILISGLAAFSEVQRQRKVPPAPIVKPQGKVDQFLKVVQEAQSLREVRAAFDQAGFTPNELDELKRKVEASPSIRQKTGMLAKQEETPSTREIEQAERAAKNRLAMISKGVIQKQDREIRNRVARMKQEVSASLKARTDLASRLTADPNAVCAADAPMIERILGPITPDAEFGILGKGLGPVPGSVDVMVDGKVFRARINGWNACSVYAQLPRDVEGVKGGQATVALKSNTGKEASGNAKFEPLLEVRRDTSPVQEVWAWYWGGHGDWDFFDYKLTNGWSVVEVHVWYHDRPDGYGHAETNYEPPRMTPDVSARTGLHAGVNAWGKIKCSVSIYFAGPKGVPHRW